MSWPVDLAATGVLGTVAYVAVLLAFGLTPTERTAIVRVLGRGQSQ
jgi:hypothetical protein